MFRKSCSWGELGFNLGEGWFLGTRCVESWFGFDSLKLEGDEC